MPSTENVFVSSVHFHYKKLTVGNDAPVYLCFMCPAVSHVMPSEPLSILFFTSFFFCCLSSCIRKGFFFFFCRKRSCVIISLFFVVFGEYISLICSVLSKTSNTNERCNKNRQNGNRMYCDARNTIVRLFRNQTVREEGCR